MFRFQDDVDVLVSLRLTMQPSSAVQKLTECTGAGHSATAVHSDGICRL